MTGKKYSIILSSFVFMMGSALADSPACTKPNIIFSVDISSSNSRLANWVNLKKTATILKNKIEKLDGYEKNLLDIDFAIIMFGNTTRTYLTFTKTLDKVVDSASYAIKKNQSEKLKDEGNNGEDSVVFAKKMFAEKRKLKENSRDILVSFTDGEWLIAERLNEKFNKIDPDCKPIAIYKEQHSKDILRSLLTPTPSDSLLALGFMADNADSQKFNDIAPGGGFDNAEDLAEKIFQTFFCA